MNMGGPASLAEVEGYLRRLFLDPRMIPLPGGPRFRAWLAGFLARRRAPAAGRRYRQIGGRSPLGAEVRRQADRLQDRLRLPVAVAMRYSAPGAEEALAAMGAAGVERVVAVSLYPQYCRATTQSSEEDLRQANRRGIDVRFVSDHHDHPLFIRALAEMPAVALGHPLAEEGRETHVLFAAHSVPLRLVRRGDPYVSQVQRTAGLLAASACGPVPWTLAFQSRVGPVGWQGPSLEEAVRDIRQKGFRRLVIQPLTFSAENLETLYDLDILLTEKCRGLGFSEVVRVPAVGDRPAYVEALESLVREALRGWEANHV